MGYLCSGVMGIVNSFLQFETYSFLIRFILYGSNQFSFFPVLFGETGLLLLHLQLFSRGGLFVGME